MKSAVITGASGFLGSFLAKLLLKSGIQVVALGRRERRDLIAGRLPEDPNLTYINLPMDQIKLLPDLLGKKQIALKDCIFYNFAWGGRQGLSDLNVAYQEQNVVNSMNAFKTAEKLHCLKFIQVGTMEEAFAEAYLQLSYHNCNYYNRHLIYAQAKRNARMMLKAVAADSATDLIIVSKSHVMGPLDYRDSLLMVTLKKMINSEDLYFTSGEQYFDVISVYDCALGFKTIGESGKRYAQYWIGSGHPRPLKEYIQIMADKYHKKGIIEFGVLNYNDIKLDRSIFSPLKLKTDTGFCCTHSYEQTLEDVHSWLTNQKSNIQFTDL